MLIVEMTHQNRIARRAKSAASHRPYRLRRAAGAGMTPLRLKKPFEVASRRINHQAVLEKMLRPLATPLMVHEVKRRRYAAHSILLPDRKLQPTFVMAPRLSRLIAAHVRNSDERVRLSAGGALKSTINPLPNPE